MVKWQRARVTTNIFVIQEGIKDEAKTRARRGKKWVSTQEGPRISEVIQPFIRVGKYKITMDGRAKYYATSTNLKITKQKQRPSKNHLLV